MTIRAIGFALVLPFVGPAGALAWGYEAHRLTMDRAIALLPAEIRPFFEAHRATLVERSIDPDLWRSAGYDALEGPHHFVNIDAEGHGPYPFAGLPRDFDAAVAKFGRERVTGTGTLPWRAAEMFGKLQQAFRAGASRGAFGRYEIVHTAAWLAHYVGDAHVPFHAVSNHDGQLTGQRGIHTRFEALLFERYRARLSIVPPPVPPVRSVADFLFDRLVEGPALAGAVLEADRKASGGKAVYDDRYYAAWFDSVRPILERRLAESVSAIAAVIAGAWEAAGRPALPPLPRRGSQ